MALIKCKDCGHDISKDAKKCPYCGKPMRTIWERQPWEKRVIEDRKLGNIVIAVLDFIIIAFGLILTLNLATQNTKYDMYYSGHKTLWNEISIYIPMLICIVLAIWVTWFFVNRSKKHNSNKK